jgi:hypothetical protein
VKACRLEPDIVRDRSSGDSVPDELRLLNDILEDDLGLPFPLRPIRRADAESSSYSSATAPPRTQQEKGFQDRTAMSRTEVLIKQVKNGSGLSGSSEVQGSSQKRRQGSTWGGLEWFGVASCLAWPLYRCAGGCHTMEKIANQKEATL